MDHVIGAGVRGISKSIAVVSEALADKKDKPKHDAGSDSNEDDDQDAGTIDREWELDEAAAQMAPEHESSDSLTKFTSLSHVDTNEKSQLQPLPQPVILPQRRPGTRSRGFIRAYAPILGECSHIGQEQFIQFLINFDKESKTSPIFDVINIACFGIGLVPSTICFAVSTAVGTVNQIVQELQGRYRSNKFLDHANETLFKPRGLYCMIMTYRPDMTDDAFLRADLSDDIHGVSLQRILDRENSTLKTKLARFRIQSGTVKSDFQIPEAAPLIYPGIDKMIESAVASSDTQAALPDSHTDGQVATVPSDTIVKTESGSNVSPWAKISSATNAAAVQDYLDRRAQTDFIAKHPNSKIANTLPPQKKYVNRFADPDHPVNSGSIFGLLSGGTFDPIASGRIRRAEHKARRRGEPPLTDAEKHDAYMGRTVRGRVTGTPSKTLPVIGKLLKKDLLYLVVVNLPTEQEMKEVMAQLE